MGEIIKHDEEQTPIKVSLDSVPVVRQSNVEISDLHVAESPTTAMYEVRPFMFDAVNIAKVRVNEPLKIVNIAVDLDLSNIRIEEMKITARAAIGSANYQGDLSYIKDNEPKYLDFEKFKAMDEFLKTSENS